MNSLRETAIAGILRTPFVQMDTFSTEVPDGEIIRLVAGELLFSSSTHPSSIDTVIIASSSPLEKAVMGKVTTACRSLGFDSHFRVLSLSSGSCSDLVALMEAAMRVSSGDSEAVIIIGEGKSTEQYRDMVELLLFPSVAVTECYPSSFDERRAFAESSVRKAVEAMRGGTSAGVRKIGFPPYFEHPLERDDVADEIHPAGSSLEISSSNGRQPALLCDFISPRREGCGALLITSADRARSSGCSRILKILGYKHIGVPEQLRGVGSAVALESLLRERTISLEDLSVLEIMETTSAQVLSTLKHLETDRVRFTIGDRDGIENSCVVNPSGGSMAYGFVPSCSGIMMLLNLSEYMAQNRGQHGALAYECTSGEALTILVESA